jgi:hypothetical protein
LIEAYIFVVVKTKLKYIYISNNIKKMCDMNDPEVIESLKFLLVSKEERIQAAARPFDGKKSVFVPDHKEGYVTASIESVDEKKGTTKVKKSNGEV